MWLSVVPVELGSSVPLPWPPPPSGPAGGGALPSEWSASVWSPPDWCPAGPPVPPWSVWPWGWSTVNAPFPAGLLAAVGSGRSVLDGFVEWDGSVPVECCVVAVGSGRLLPDGFVE